MTMYNLENYYLDLEKVSKLDNEDERSRIHSYYMDMLCAQDDKVSKSIFNTLYRAEYLKEVRDEKLKQILND